MKCKPNFFLCSWGVPEQKLFRKKNTWFCSELNADSNHMIFSKKYWGRKNGLTITCPLSIITLYYSLNYIPAHYGQILCVTERKKNVCLFLDSNHPIRANYIFFN